MQLFKIPETIAEVNPGREVFFTIVGDGQVLPEYDWVKFHLVDDFAQLVQVHGDLVVSVIRDEARFLDMVALVVGHPAVTGITMVRVDNVVPYTPTAAAEAIGWAPTVVDFERWKAEADEQARIAEIAHRESLSTDEKRVLDNRRSDGTLKKPNVTQVDESDSGNGAEEDEVPPVF